MKKLLADLGLPELGKLVQLEQENMRLKVIVADLSLDDQLLKETISNLLEK